MVRLGRLGAGFDCNITAPTGAKVRSGTGSLYGVGMFETWEERGGGCGRGETVWMPSMHDKSYKTKQ